jgi:hypothetical protein
MAIELTVALPIYKNKNIVWLALESLCRQENIDFEWELIVCEEQMDQFGLEELRKYQVRLDAVGCKLVRYIGLNYRVSLPQKWKRMADKRSETSIGFVLQSSDDYSDCHRLKESYDKLKEGFDWVHNRYGNFYDISSKRVLYYDAKSINLKTGLNMAVSSVLLPKLQDSTIEAGVDTWFFKTVQPSNVYWNENAYSWSLYTDGNNHISKRRKEFYAKPRPPFFKSALNGIGEMFIPGEIVKRLQTMK